MKKLMFGMAAALALCGMADIESKNVVGYQTKELEKGKFYILGVQFEGMDGVVDINKICSGLIGSDYDDDFAFRSTAPQVQVPNAKGGYDIYYYLNDGYFVNEQGEDDEKAGWCDLWGTIAGDDEAGAEISGELSLGVSAWVKSVQNAGEFLQAGQVPSDDTIEVNAPASFALRSNAYPVAFNLNDATKVEFSGLTGVDYDDDFAFRQTAPQIQVPNAKGGYDIYYYLNNGYFVNEQGEDDEKAGWCDLWGTIAGDEEAGAEISGDIDVAQGFWTKGVGSAFKMTFKK